MAAPSLAVDELEQYRRPVTRYLQHLVGNAADAQDLAQETLLRAHRQLAQLRDPEALESWLYRIATHASIDFLRQRARTAHQHVEAAIEDLPVPDQRHPSPLMVIQQSEMSQCVQRVIANLSDAHKAVALLHDAEGMTSVEIADLLQLPLTTVKMRLHRARQQLQSLLNSACEFGRDERGVFICEPKKDGTSG
jgi:RNA polymerase sigma-70 factor, ECF subfamily